MGMAKQMVIDYFSTQNIVPESVGENVLECTGTFEGGKMDMLMLFDEDDKHVQIVGLNFCQVPAAKLEAMLKVCNELNAKYRFFKFIVDEEHNTVRAEMDAIIQLDSCGEECFELIMRLYQIVGEAYPEIMKGIWA